jgi:hypothetical protein
MLQLAIRGLAFRVYESQRDSGPKPKVAAPAATLGLRHTIIPNRNAVATGDLTPRKNQAATALRLKNSFAPVTQGRLVPPAFAWLRRAGANLGLWSVIPLGLGTGLGTGLGLGLGAGLAM